MKDKLDSRDFKIYLLNTIFTDEMKDWLNKNKRIVSIEIILDGNRTAHNIGRDNSYDIQVSEYISF